MPRRAQQTDDTSAVHPRAAFAVLGLAATTAFSEAAVRRAYRARALQLHPDRNPNGAEEFKRVVAAYEALCAEFAARHDGAELGAEDFTPTAGSGGAASASTTASHAATPATGDTAERVARDRERARGQRTNVSAYAPFGEDDDAMRAFQEDMARFAEMERKKEQRRSSTPTATGGEGSSASADARRRRSTTGDDDDDFFRLTRAERAEYLKREAAEARRKIDETLQQQRDDAHEDHRAREERREQAVRDEWRAEQARARSEEVQHRSEELREKYATAAPQADDAAQRAKAAKADAAAAAVKKQRYDTLVAKVVDGASRNLSATSDDELAAAALADAIAQLQGKLDALRARSGCRACRVCGGSDSAVARRGCAFACQHTPPLCIDCHGDVASCPVCGALAAGL